MLELFNQINNTGKPAKHNEIQKMMAESVEVYPGLLDLLQHAPNFSMTVLSVLSVTSMHADSLSYSV